MNKHIKALAMKAGKVEQIGPETWSDNQVEELAKLIVQDCINILRESGNEKSVDALFSIKEHFGVK